jgi:hypothetical protein
MAMKISIDATANANAIHRSRRLAWTVDRYLACSLVVSDLMTVKALRRFKD